MVAPIEAGCIRKRLEPRGERLLRNFRQLRRILSAATPSLIVAERFTGACTSLNIERRRSVRPEEIGLNPLDKGKSLRRTWYRASSEGIDLVPGPPNRSKGVRTGTPRFLEANLVLTCEELDLHHLW